LLFTDLLVALVVWTSALFLQGVWGHGSLTQLAYVSCVTNVGVWITLCALLGFYPGYGMNTAEELRRQTHAVMTTLAITLFFAFTLKVSGSLSRLLLVVGFLGLLALAPLGRHFAKAAMMKAGLWGKPVVIVGAGEAGRRLISTLKNEWKLGFRPIAVFDDRITPAEGAIEGLPFGGTLGDAMDLATKHKINTAIFAMPHTRRERLVPLVSRSSETFRHVMVIPNLGGITNSAVVARDFAGTFGVEIKHNLLDPWSRRIKRAVDLFGTVVGGLLISPLLIAIAVLIKLDSSGPVFYGQLRPGAGGKNFRCWKFRTMRVDAESYLSELLQNDKDLRAEWERNHKLRDDPRVSRIGSFLRKSSLDELPQLWNVLRGEMSLVGPRPALTEEIPKYGEVYELYKRMRPGITGLWQVNGRGDISHEERIAIVAYYVNNWSVWLDIMILIRTVRIVILGRGAF
jgi:Undecaprenyl-phosphate galactose phosphotransferase WbaP